MFDSKARSAFPSRLKLPELFAAVKEALVCLAAELAVLIILRRRTRALSLGAPSSSRMVAAELHGRIDSDDVSEGIKASGMRMAKRCK
ncbi:hypothetical protein [Pseudoramibacter faecis]|uniref:hypothetical protein n=1 Tax=Pseudoramibacter faecis TaxID=3108534 RepID=UPI002E77FF62|nr:hypothetical protein [Pseudoramibacter sp. HA2172]